MSSRSLSEQLKDLFSPKPKDYDPETSEWAGATSTRLVKQKSESLEGLEEYDESKQSEAYRNAPVVRSMKAQPAMGNEYRGKKVSRAELGLLPSELSTKKKPISDSLDTSKQTQSDSESGSGELEISDSSNEDRMDIDEFEEDYDQEEGDFDIDLDAVDSSSDEEHYLSDMDALSDDQSNQDEDELQDEAEALERELMDAEDEEKEQAEHLKRIRDDADEEMTRARHTLNQKVLWDSMLDLRFKLQAPQTDANRLPQKDTFDSFLFLNEIGVKKLKLKEQISDKPHEMDQNEQNETTTTTVITDTNSKIDSVNLASKLDATRSIIKESLNDMLFLQSLLIENNPESVSGIQQSEKEIGQTNSSRKRSRQQFEQGAEWMQDLDTDQIWETIHQFQAPIAHLSEQTIDKWARKALYATNVTSSKFKAVNQSISAQVDQIMSNKEKVLQRTRLKRDNYHILGKNDEAATTRMTAEQAASGAADREIDSHDPEIFDDGDFCQILLKEVIEHGLSETNDPIELTRRYLAIKAQRKQFKKSERKPSKGKTLKYAEQPKLVAYMAPAPNKYPMHDAYVTSQLIMSLFGQKPNFSQLEESSDEEESGSESESMIPLLMQQTLKTIDE